jgi:DNA-binding NarL/FixJ family response regulator
MGTKVLIVDDHEVIRTGVESLLVSEGFEIVGKASTGQEAISMAQRKKPEVVVLDVRMDEVDGLEVLEKIRTKNPALKVVMLSTYDSLTYVARAIALGAVDYVLKGGNRAEIVTAVRKAAKGESPKSDSLISRTRAVMQRRREESDTGFPLTHREIQVLRHLALGLSNREIANSLEISIETVKEHVQNILRKLDATDRTQAAVRAVKKGLV